MLSFAAHCLRGLMVLCPYVFLWTKDSIPPLSLQASEVAAAFWIPIHCLLDGQHRGYHAVDVADRMAATTSMHLKPIFNMLLGPMYFSGIRLKPEEISRSSRAGYGSIRGPGGEATMGDLTLWGITYAVLADMLDHIPPFDFLTSFQYPHFKSWDFRVLVWILSYRYRKERLEELGKTNGVRGSDGIKRMIDTDSTFIESSGASISTIDLLIKGYYKHVRRAVYLAIAARVTILAGIFWLVFHLLGRKTS
ncbi:hypothetical protein ABW19_dt0207465 [Dactylella cylindrospora]|nr:hypothetical protein ABW19_dt0207465 [Dactylella cylindrospora]